MIRNEEVHQQDGRWSLATTASVFLIEFLLPSALSSYGVFFDEFVDDGYFSFHAALWTPVVYIASLNIANPWGRKLCERFKNTRYYILRILIATATILTVLGQLLACFLPNLTTQVLLYGILGGCVTGFTISIIKTYTVENFQGKPRILEATVQIAKALTLFVLPHIVLFLVSYYNIFRAQALFSAFLLNAIPISFIACRKQKRNVEPSLARYRTVPGYLYNQDIELPTINKRCSNGIVNPMVVKRQNSSDDDDDDSSTSSEDSYTFVEVKEESEQIANFRMKTDMGVEILPEIPEEDESELMESEKLSNDIKRLSRISNKLEEIIGNDDKTGVLLETNNLERLGSRKKRQSSYFSDFRRRNNAECCSPYQKYLFRKRFRVLGDILWGSLIKPIKISFTSYYFFPSLFGKACMSLAYAIYISTITHVALVNGASYKVDVTEAVFLLTFISVAWCFFLISLPWVMNMAKIRLKILHIFGLLVTSGSFSMIYISQSHDMITLSCLVFGLGYGTISFTEDLVYKESLGVRKWNVIIGTLDTLSGVLVIIIYFIIYMFKLSIRNLFLVFYVLVTINCILWIVTPFCRFLWLRLRKKRSAGFIT